ncbi:hypothetical protein Slin15195_G122070 [Septoria linicola]|uniref:Uncharacterized protein n=1 Tax=Septoria linicola TaxID=215465 RepID=A0A9Q9B7L9_9PEZI|nr:hypothetical protein Slin14017_G078280 [Septoria linicola]USW58888.1 hypothetical protein Slin15195_G122070 [Septoria linicola]
MTSSQPGLGAYLRPLAYTSTVLLGVSGITTSILFVPALLRPIVSAAPAASSTSAPATKSASSPSPSPFSLEVPSTPIESGRLTPPVSQRTFDFGQHLGSSGTYKAVARQFAQLQASSTFYNVPLESIAVAAFATLAYGTRSTAQWRSWVAAATALVSIDLLKTVFMAPLAVKLLCIAGDAEPVEPYEDAPIDREADKSNTVQFLRKWSILNLGSSIAVIATAAFAWTAEA